ncbi:MULTISPECIES: sigma-70 family RNA polymerase sigma factor [unclassified Crossiella]|uniref:sigma-70 family RNA polymerase sigma factor n=1 Tax=unclassified Crossiella TaxID=2620835 RepID=UPI001FFEEE47|nr:MULTISPECIES: sigma-70 family RNA polymerase sigma factor [unclassified Crossiella]MCK2239484.1 sigma-70 family RNA polymerase sigma factor [Crossiella sp. S99.2]MCK2252179.1 sigma-70 family RNA polymerase sigma factor [Crossiella sp. S99.1]
MDFPVFFAQTCPGMLARALMLTHNRQDAEDAVQEAYAEAMRRWAELADRAPEEWVYQAVKRRLWAAARRWRMHRPLELVVSLPARCSTEQAAEVRLVLDALSRLPRKHRVVAYLHWAEGLSARQIAAELDTSESAVTAMLGKARVALDSLLGLTGVRDREALTGKVRRVTLPGQPGEPADAVAEALRRTENQLRAGAAEDAEALARISGRLGLS